MEIIADSFEDFSAGPQLAGEQLAGEQLAGEQLAGVFDSAAVSTDVIAAQAIAAQAIAEKGKIGRPAGTKIPEGYKTGSLASRKLESRKAVAGGAIVLKTDNQKIRELKQILLNEAGESVVMKAIEIALNDNHPSQAAMIKLCMDRTLPVSLFEKDKQQRSAVTINITGLGAVVEDAAVIDAPATIEGDVTDV